MIFPRKLLATILLAIGAFRMLRAQAGVTWSILWNTARAVWKQP